MQNRFLKLIFISTISFFQFSANANETKKEWSVGVGNENCPFACYDKDKQLGGLYVDIVKGIAKNLNKEIKFITMPWKRQFSETEKGTMDIIMGAGYRPDRAKIFYYSNPIFNEPSRMFVLKKNLDKYKFKSLHDIDNFKEKILIGYTRGKEFSTLFGTLMKKNDFSSKMEASNSDDVVIKKIESERVDAGFFPDYFSAKSLLVAGKLENEIVPFPLAFDDDKTSDYSFFLISKVSFSKEDADKFNKSFSEFVKTPEYKSILEKYLKPNDIQSLKIMD